MGHDITDDVIKICDSIWIWLFAEHSELNHLLLYANTAH